MDLSDVGSGRPASRRAVLGGLAGAGLAGTGLAGTGLAGAGPAWPAEAAAPAPSRSFDRHRFGVNYVPSRHWYFVWNDWRPDAVARDFDAIAALGADHLRVMLVWPWFQPNPRLVSGTHLDRLDAMTRLAAARGLDVLVTLYTGWLSGFAFRPPYLEKEEFYASPKWAAAQDLLLERTAARMNAHPNFLGFDLGNEINCCWEATPPVGDRWQRRVLGDMRRLSPGRIHVNGVDHQPWFASHTFSPAALVAEQPMVAIHSWPFWTGAGKHGGPLSKPYTLLPAAMTALVRAYARDRAKPVWLQEFGACREEMPDRQVVPWLEATVAGAVAEGVSWFTWWGSHDVDRALDFHPFEYDLGLLDRDNRPKARGLAFRRLADAHRGKPVARPDRLAAAPSAVGTDATWAWLLRWMDGDKAGG